ncbi:MAG: class I adenylate-forming enzyme family protein [Spongiibacteraceae bacterium]
MISFLGLLGQRDFRQLLVKPFASYGYMNVAKGLLKANTLRAGSRDQLPRYIVQGMFRQLGNRKAVITESSNLSFGELEARSVRLANALYKYGVRQQDHVAILLDNEQAWFECMLACMLSGIKMPMLNTHLNPVELVKCINSCAPKVLVYAACYAEIISSIEADCPSVETFVCTKIGNLPEHHIDLDAFILSGEHRLPPGGFGLPQLPFSGGSTGVPKFIREESDCSQDNSRMKGLTPADLNNLRKKFASGYARLGLGSIKKGLVSLIPSPLYHTGAQAAVAPLYIGGTVIPMAKFDAEKFLEITEREKVNFTFVAPTMLERILKLDDCIKHKYDLSSMEMIFCSGAPCPDYVKSQINALFKKQGASRNVFNEFYGSSEVTLISVLRADDYEENPARYKSVGKAIASDVRIYNHDEKRWCKTGEIGHVLVRNPRIYKVRAGKTEEINNSLIEVGGVYWYDDGCLGYLDADNFLYLTARSKDMIISGGVNVFPPEIEEALKTHPDVLDVAVVKVADDDLGEVAGAVVQMLEGRKITEQALIDYAREHGLYGFKLPKYIKMVDELPKNSVGKIRKAELEQVFHDLCVKDGSVNKIGAQVHG